MPVSIKFTKSPGLGKMEWPGISESGTESYFKPLFSVPCFLLKLSYFLHMHMTRHVHTQRFTAYGISKILTATLRAAIYQGNIEDLELDGAQFEYWLFHLLSV